MNLFEKRCEGKAISIELNVWFVDLTLTRWDPVDFP